MGADRRGGTRAVVKLARTFGLQTVAEGIETAEQLEQLRSIGVDFAQGYFLARPLDTGAMDVYLRQAARSLAGAVAMAGEGPSPLALTGRLR